MIKIAGIASTAINIASKLMIMKYAAAIISAGKQLDAAPAMGGKLTLRQYAPSVPDSIPVAVYRPRLSFWLPLLIPMVFPIYLGFALILDRGYLEASACFAFAAVIVGYNASARLCVGDDISFARYGRTLWRIRSSGVRVTSGRTGELPILSAFVFADPSGASGAVPKGMLAPAASAELKSVVEVRGGVWCA